jgi:hypothetical protein
MLLVLRTVPRTRQQHIDAALAIDDDGARIAFSTSMESEGPVSWLQPVQAVATIRATKAARRPTLRASATRGLIPIIVVPL